MKIPRTLAVLSFLFLCTLSSRTSAAPDSFDAGDAAKTNLRIPVFFIENKGQMDSGADYYIAGKDKSLYFNSRGVTFSLLENSHPNGLPNDLLENAFGGPEHVTGGENYRWNVRADFIDANPGAMPVGQDATSATINYFKGSPSEWKKGLRTFASLRYPDLWKGIDLVYSGGRGHLEYRFIVQPGADPQKIRLSYQGADRVFVNQEGRLEIETPVGGFEEGALYVYQERDGKREEVAANFVVERQSVVGFQLGAYDRERPLIIDPVVLVYAGFIGGSGHDSGQGIAVDGSGNAYVTGKTTSSQLTFPETVGPDLTANVGNWDAFVAKVAPDGASLIYAGFIGGSGEDKGLGIAVDGGGNAYVTGSTQSTESSFPVKGGPDLSANGGGVDAFVAKVAPDGASLIYSGFIGGTDFDNGNGIAVDGSGSAYVAGATTSTESSFPVKGGPDLSANGGNWDAFVAKIAPNGASLIYAGFIGGNSADVGHGIAVDEYGNAYVVGHTGSDGSTFPVKHGPELTANGGIDAFVAKVAPNGASLIYAGFIGGVGNDYGNGIATKGGYAYVTGETASNESTFPVLNGPDDTANGGIDAFVAKVSASGSQLDYAGFIGGAEDDKGNGIAVDVGYAVYVTGTTFSSESTFPVTVGPDLSASGNENAFVAKLSVNGSQLTYAGFIGGYNGDYGHDIAVDGSGNAYVTGGTYSPAASFPVANGPYLTLSGLEDAFVAKVAILNFSDLSDLISIGPMILLHTCPPNCDDGNPCTTDSCGQDTDHQCQHDPIADCPPVSVCGNEITEGIETCDDGNTTSGDGCNSSCQIEQPLPPQCPPNCDDGNLCTTDSCGQNTDYQCQNDPIANCPPVSVCGNGITEGIETCDDGNTVDTDACKNDCSRPGSGGTGGTAGGVTTGGTSNDGGGCSLIR